MVARSRCVTAQSHRQHSDVIDSTLVRIAGNADLMRLAPTRRATLIVAWLVISIITALNAILIGLTATSTWAIVVTRALQSPALR